MRICIISAFGIPGENDGERSVVDFCSDMGLYASNTYFKLKNLFMYTRETRGPDGVQVMSMINLVLVKKYMLHFVQDVRKREE